jgi:D-alanyl-D-alanine carboxypeptidase
MSESLREKQSRFALMAARLILKAEEMGYTVTLGEAWRTPPQARLNAEQGTGIRNSLHLIRLAIDLNLFRGNVYLANSEDHRRLGEWWESIGGTWGGRFGDGNHYSLEHEGRK